MFRIIPKLKFKKLSDGNKYRLIMFEIAEIIR